MGTGPCFGDSASEEGDKKMLLLIYSALFLAFSCHFIFPWNPYTAHKKERIKKFMKHIQGYAGGWKALWSQQQTSRRQQLARAPESVIHFQVVPALWTRAPRFQHDLFHSDGFA